MKTQRPLSGSGTRDVTRNIPEKESEKLNLIDLLLGLDTTAVIHLL